MPADGSSTNTKRLDSSIRKNFLLLPVEGAVVVVLVLVPEEEGKENPDEEPGGVVFPILNALFGFILVRFPPVVFVVDVTVPSPVDLFVLIGRPKEDVDDEAADMRLALLPGSGGIPWGVLPGN